MHIDLGQLAAGILYGGVAAALYLALLWVTVRRLSSSGRFDRGTAGFTLLRWGGVALAAYLAMTASPSVFLGGFVGFLLARFLILSLARQPRVSTGKEA